MESFCASFPPLLLPQDYLNDMSSPNIQLLSWEFPPCWLLSARLCACGCQKGCDSFCVFVFYHFRYVCLLFYALCPLQPSQSVFIKCLNACSDQIEHSSALPGHTVCLYVCVHRCVCGWVTALRSHLLPVWLSSSQTSDKNKRSR